MFAPAERKKAKLRLCLSGPSGSGKTFSALQIASGITSRIAVIDTERGSASLYSNVCQFDVCELPPPFAPSKYVEQIKAAESAGYELLIIDSLSHAWEGEGGILDMHEKATTSQRNQNSYTAWRHVTPKHNELVNAILQSQMHVIVTLRTKTAYEVQDNNRGKKVPVKIGMKPIQRDGIEYEFTTVFDISAEHVATASKDRTGMFVDEPFQPSKETGAGLLAWLETGADPLPQPTSGKDWDDAEMKKLEQDIANSLVEKDISQCRKLLAHGLQLVREFGTPEDHKNWQKVIEQTTKKVEAMNDE